MTALLVASTGGHLSQLHQLRARFSALESENVVWVTFDTPQSRSLLAGEDVRFVPLTAPRDLKHVMSNALRARSILNEVQPDLVVSTGSAIALSFLPLAAQRGIPTHYVESAARGDGPSLTGRVLARDSRITLYTQHPNWEAGPWNYRGSVFDGWRAVTRPQLRDVKRVVVTLGTLDYPFGRLLRRLVEILPPDADVTWQTGTTDVSGLGINAQPSLPSFELAAAVATADVVIAHAGCGSAIAALEAGRTPVLVPRERRFGEHVDDHQRQIAQELSRRGLAIGAPVDSLSWDMIQAAAQTQAQLATPEPFHLEGTTKVMRVRPGTSNRFTRGTAWERESDGDWLGQRDC